jgi:hypothetical protein
MKVLKRGAGSTGFSNTKIEQIRSQNRENTEQLISEAKSIARSLRKSAELIKDKKLRASADR